MIFSENFQDDGEKFTGAMNANAIMNAAVKKMQSFVSVVTDENYDAFIERERATKHKILLFTEKKTGHCGEFGQASDIDPSRLDGFRVQQEFKRGGKKPFVDIMD